MGMKLWLAGAALLTGCAVVPYTYFRGDATQAELQKDLADCQKTAKEANSSPTKVRPTSDTAAALQTMAGRDSNILRESNYDNSVYERYCMRMRGYGWRPEGASAPTSHRQRNAASS